MNVDRSAYRRGINEGLKRAQREFPIFDRKDLPRDVGDVLEKVLADWPKEAPAGFIALFVELSVVAAVARLVNNEPPLSYDEVAAFLGHSFIFFRTFKYEFPEP